MRIEIDTEYKVTKNCSKSIDISELENFLKEELINNSDITDLENAIYEYLQDIDIYFLICSEDVQSGEIDIIEQGANTNELVEYFKYLIK